MLKNLFNKKAIVMPALFLVAIWLGFLLQQIGWIKGCAGAIIPLNLSGLQGIVFSPFLHGSLEHILGNSIPLLVLSFLLYQFYPQVANKVMLYGWLFSGLAVWLTPPFSFFYYEFYTSCIIGASGVIYVLAFFLFISGVLRRNLKLLAISLLVAVYFGSMIWGMIPEELLFSMNEPGRVAWQSHLWGGIIGTVMAFVYQKIGTRREKFIWEYPNYYSEKDDLMWQEYLQKHPEHFEKFPPTPKEDIWEYLDELRRKNP